jgi:hypothetical protein
MGFHQIRQSRACRRPGLAFICTGPPTMPIPPSIAERVETIRRNLNSSIAPDYKETDDEIKLVEQATAPVAAKPGFSSAAEPTGASEAEAAPEDRI